MQRFDSAETKRERMGGKSREANLVMQAPETFPERCRHMCLAVRVCARVRMHLERVCICALLQQVSKCPLTAPLCPLYLSMCILFTISPLFAFISPHLTSDCVCVRECVWVYLVPQARFARRTERGEGREAGWRSRPLWRETQADRGDDMWVWWKDGEEDHLTCMCVPWCSMQHCWCVHVCMYVGTMQRMRYLSWYI